MARAPLNIYALINKLSIHRREKHLCAPQSYFSECPPLLSWIYSLVALWKTIMNKWTVKFDDYCSCNPWCPTLKWNFLCIHCLPTGADGLLQSMELPALFFINHCKYKPQDHIPTFFIAICYTSASGGDKGGPLQIICCAENVIGFNRRLLKELNSLRRLKHAGVIRTGRKLHFIGIQLDAWSKGWDYANPV